MMDDRIDTKLDKIIDKLSEHSIILAQHGVIHEQNAKELAHHISRTNLLETKLEKDILVSNMKFCHNLEY